MGTELNAEMAERGKEMGLFLTGLNLRDPSTGVNLNRNSRY